MTLTKPAKVFTQAVGGLIGCFGLILIVFPTTEAKLLAAACMIGGFGLLLAARNAAHPDD